MFYAAFKKLITAAIVAVALFGNWSTAIDQPAVEQVDAGLTRALTTFAAARALNAAISVAQGTEFSAGVGLSVTLSIGEALDPINDMIESFSNLMLLASVAFGIQKVLLTIGQDVLIQWLFTGVVLVWGAFTFFSGKRNRWLNALLIVFLMIRFAIPVATLSTDAIYQHFLQQQYEQSRSTIERSADEMNHTTGEFRKQSGEAPPKPSTIQPNPALPTFSPEIETNGQESQQPTPEKTWWDDVIETVQTGTEVATGSVRDTISSVTQTVNPRAYVDRLTKQASEATDDIIELMVVFLLQTVLLPIFLVWAMYAVLRGILVNALESR